MSNSINGYSEFVRPADSSPIFQSPGSSTDFGTVQAPEMSKIALGSTKDKDKDKGPSFAVRLTSGVTEGIKAYQAVGGGPVGVVAGVVAFFAGLFGGGKKK